jgi:hypothetical protein
MMTTNARTRLLQKSPTLPALDDTHALTERINAFIASKPRRGALSQDEIENLMALMGEHRDVHLRYMNARKVWGWVRDGTIDIRYKKLILGVTERLIICRM